MAAWIAIVTGFAAIVLAVATVLLARRGARLQADLRRTRTTLRPEVAGSLDLDDVVARILDTAMALPGVDAAVLELEGDARGGMVKSAGMSRDDAVRQGELGSKFAVPLEGELGPLGSLTVYSGTVRELEHDVGNQVAELVRRAVPALDNAFRYREARRLADLDALTGLRNRRFFHETLQRECTRAHRYGRSLALLVLDSTISRRSMRGGAPRRRRRPGRTAARVRGVLRASDIACAWAATSWRSSSPSRRDPGRAAVAGVDEAVSSQPIGAVPQLTLSGGIAALVPGDDATSFFERADDALYRAKQAGKAQLAGT